MIRLVLDPKRVEIGPIAEFWNSLREPRVGVMLHYDGSATDAGGLGWLTSRDCGVSYNLLVFRDGSWGILAPLDRRAWHAGVCRPSGSIQYRDANSAFFGVCLLSSGHDDATPLQALTAAWLVARLFEGQGWDRRAEAHRVTTHRAEAWERGRKMDPEGRDLRNPIFTRRDVVDLLPYFVDVEPLR